MIVCEGLNQVFREMFIDEERNYVLTKYATTKGKSSKSESDHNVMIGQFNLTYGGVRSNSKREIFNFRNAESQQMFYEVTTNSTKMSKKF